VADQEAPVQRELETKYQRLKEILADIGGVVVAYSGGVDSTLLLKAALEALGDRAFAVTVASAIHPTGEVEEAAALARQLGARHSTLELDVMENEQLVSNSPERCYHCKKELFRRLLGIVEEAGLEALVEGSNVDDLRDYRPGLRALEELKVRSPLREAELTKNEIRAISKALGLPTWDRPSLACLASRFPYGDRLTPERLARVEAAEWFLRGLGIRQVRVRDYGQTARIEVDISDLKRTLSPENRTRIVEELHRLGYLYATVDLEGYRAGSMNVPLSSQEVDITDK